MRLKYCVYILISLKDKDLYVGYTTDLQERLTAHFKGEVPSTAPRRPFRLIYVEYHHAMSDAKRRERYLKTSAGKAALKRMLRDSLAEFRTSPPPPMAHTAATAHGRCQPTHQPAHDEPDVCQ